MADYISREAAISEILSEPTDAHYPSWYAEKLKQISAADVVSRDCFNRILAENDKLREENEKLRKDLAATKAEFESYKSWEDAERYRSAQGMW